MSISIYTGLIVPIVSQSLHNTYPDSTVPNYNNMIFQKSVMTMCGLGVGEIIGGIAMGIIVDKIGAKKSCFINCGLIVLQTALVCVYIVYDHYSYLAYIMTFAWGL